MSARILKSKGNVIVLYVWCVVLSLLLALLLLETWVIVVEHVLLPDLKHFDWGRLDWPNVFKNFNIGLYWWFIIGVSIYVLFRRLVVPRFDELHRKFMSIETLSHELSHYITGLSLGRRVHSIHAEEKTGEVMTSGSTWSRPMTSLAPYTMPFLTYLPLALRTLIDWQSTWLYDILAGITMGFHLIVFVNDTKLYQTDINRFPSLWFPGLYIAVFHVFNLTVIAVTFWSSKNFFTAIWWVIQHLFIWG